MSQHFLTRTAVLGSLLALAASSAAVTIEGNDTSEFVAIASTEHSAPDANPGYVKAPIFGVPREARILFW